MSHAFQIHADDNVATLLADAAAGENVVTVGSERVLTARQAIALGHKIALVAIPAGSAVVKFGVTIGIATTDIPAGEWVHLHNIASAFDERSKSLDVQTGAVTDTKYE